MSYTKTLFLTKGILLYADVIPSAWLSPSGWSSTLYVAGALLELLVLPSLSHTLCCRKGLVLSASFMRECREQLYLAPNIAICVHLPSPRHCEDKRTFEVFKAEVRRKNTHLGLAPRWERSFSIEIRRAGELTQPLELGLQPKICKRWRKLSLLVWWFHKLLFYHFIRMHVFTKFWEVGMFPQCRWRGALACRQDPSWPVQASGDSRWARGRSPRIALAMNCGGLFPLKIHRLDQSSWVFN